MEDGMRAVAIGVAAHRSIEENRVVGMDEIWVEVRASRPETLR